MSDSGKIYATFFGDAEHPVEWKNEEEKKLLWFFDDLHCPNPISPLYFDIGGWWGITCEYMYRRFGAPIGEQWIAKKIGGYVYTTVVPNSPNTDFKSMLNYYLTEMPIYAEKFLDWWRDRYLPEIRKNHEYMDNFDAASKSLAEYLIHLEDCLDIQEREFKIHWILNLAQFQAGLQFRALYKEVIGEIDETNIGKIIVSDSDRNWDSLKALWEMKEYIKGSPELTEFIKKPTTEIMASISSVPNGGALLQKVEDYQEEYGYKSVFPHEYIHKTWKEDPTPIYEALRIYVAEDYDFSKAYENCKAEQKKAIAEMLRKVKDSSKRENLEKAMNLAIHMAPLTPDHHFYIDQACYARMRLMFLELGKKFIAEGIIDDPEDIFMFEYEEIRRIAFNHEAFDSKALVKKRRSEMAEAARRVPREWYGTATHWHVYEEPYKSLWGWPYKFDREMELKKETEAAGSLKGLPASPGVAEGIARFVASPAEFDKIQNGDILVCKTTNPAWVVSFSKIAGLVTDTGGALSHPAVVSREFGIPAVTGTSKATRVIKSGMRVRVDGSAGMVTILG
jgi:pyruvate,water dikinase